jgi:hypothetical protein
MLLSRHGNFAFYHIVTPAVPNQSNNNRKRLCQAFRQNGDAMIIRRKRQVLSGAILLSTIALSSDVVCAATDKDIQVASRTIGFIEPSLTGSVATAIVYDKNNAVSRAEAEQIRAALIAQGAVKAAMLKPQLVDVEALDGLASSKIAFVTSGLSGQQSVIFKEASRRGIVTISTDMSCVNAGRCVVGVASSPKVQIVVSRAARAATNAKFGAAFMMLITEK